MGSAPRLKLDGGIPNRLERVAEAAGVLEHMSPMIVANIGWDAVDRVPPIFLIATDASEGRVTAAPKEFRQ